jgi:hypothetical protein
MGPGGICLLVLEACLPVARELSVCSECLFEPVHCGAYDHTTTRKKSSRGISGFTELTVQVFSRNELDRSNSLQLTS